MSRLLGVAAVQMELVAWNVEATLKRMEQRIQVICRDWPWISLVCFPELCVIGENAMEPMPPGLQWDDLAEPIPGPVAGEFASMARRYGVWLQPGSMPERDGQAIYNTAPVFSPDGELVARYRKVFPWRPYEQVEAGQEFCTFDIPDLGRIGLCICYDGWFPEVIRSLVWMGAEVILHPTFSSTSDRPLEVIIEQAHAILNQCYMVNTNAAPIAARGRSLIVDPSGHILAEGGTDDVILTAILDLEQVRQVREFGTLGLSQTLKQWRDTHVVFPAYGAGVRQGPLFESLGPLRLPRKLT